LSNDKIWEELSKVYNMPNVPDEAKEIIGNVMLELDDSTIVSCASVSSVFRCSFDDSVAQGTMLTPPNGH